ncbi:MAG TPA: hypothetical protein VGH87_27585, partial [Polyangiaceae bacterium]
MTARMEVLPFRREPRTIAIDVEACRAEVTRALPPDWATWRATTAELSSALDEARAKYSGDSRARASALAEAVASLAVAWTSLAAGWSVEGPGMDPLQPTVAPLVDLWVAEHGIDYALDALVAAYGVMQTMSPTQIEPASDRVTASRQPGRWRRLREHVCASGDATYAAARAHAESLRTRAAWGARFITSFVFPSEAEWARADAASSSGVQRLALVGTAIDGRTCAKILRNADDAGMIFEDGRFATMVEMLGDDAIEPLRAVMTMQRLDLSVPTALLARFATPDVATTMVGALDR